LTYYYVPSLELFESLLSSSLMVASKISLKLGSL